MDIDNALREIIDSNFKSRPTVHFDVEAAITQIKAAFTEANWIDKTELKSWCHTSELLTDQEWYNRFEKELDNLIKENFMDSIYPHDALKAAKKASGLE